MKITKDTIAILKNFASINSNLVLKEGNKIATISAGKNILAEAIVLENFPVEFGIYDLNEFLGVLSLFPDPEINFNEDNENGGRKITIKGQDSVNSVQYFSANVSNLLKTPTLKEFPESSINFLLTSTMIQQIQRVSSILKVGDFSFIGNSETIEMVVGNKPNATGNTYNATVGTTDVTFRINFKVENLKVMPDDYNVAVGGKKTSRFTSTTQKLVYYIALEADSTFDF